MARRGAGPAAAVMERTRLRRADASDDVFLAKLYATTREDLTLAGFDTRTRTRLLAQHHAARRAAFAGFDQQIVLDGDVAVGLLVTHRTRHELRLVDLALLPRHRGRGVGTHLVGALQRQAAQERVPLRLTVPAGNPSRVLYERLGFLVTGIDATGLTMEWAEPPNVGSFSAL